MLLDCIFEVDPIDASNAADTEVYFEVYCETFRMDSGKTYFLKKKKIRSNELFLPTQHIWIRLDATSN